MNTSTTSSRIFPIFLLLACLCLCDARRLGLAEKKTEINRKHVNTRNNQEDVKPKALSEGKAVDDASSRGLEASRGGRIDESKQRESPTDGEGVGVGDANSKVDDGGRGKRTTLDETASCKRVSRSWKVPQKKNRPREEHPGFNLDYMQPSTHPPHHN